MKSVIHIYNSDKLCALRAILVAKSVIDKDFGVTKRLLKQSEINKQVRVICKKLNLKNEPMGIPEIKQIERYLKYYSISIMDGKKGLQQQKFYYKGPVNKYFIYLLFTESHYNVIKSMKALLYVSYYCNYCKKGYNDNADHTCTETCFCCKKQGCLKILENVQFVLFLVFPLVDSLDLIFYI